MNPKRKWWDEVFKDETEKEGWKNAVGNANLIVKKITVGPLVMRK